MRLSISPCSLLVSTTAGETTVDSVVDTGVAPTESSSEEYAFSTVLASFSFWAERKKILKRGKW